jgi:7,8-dihydropterin-6-yl-methyl-4-(beta-D-ribofuranosyl)aminobenzene 5'-phosphate synthase
MPTEVAEKPRPEPFERLTITIVYDNNEYDERLKTAWGFSCLVERGELSLLFDTGGDAPTLLSNMEVLELDPRDIDTVVLSHIHSDHVGGLGGICVLSHDCSLLLSNT